MKIIRIADKQTIGPVYHGTPYQFGLQDFRGDIKYFTDDRNFAHDYASQKSFERQMDADITVISAYLKGVVFDPQNPEHINKVLPFFPDKIIVFNDFGMKATLTKDKWRELISGVVVAKPKFLPEDLEGKQPGDGLPDNMVYDKPIKYQLLQLTPDEVVYTTAYAVQDIMNGYQMVPFMAARMRENGELPHDKQEVINDLVNLSPAAFHKKYKEFELSGQRRVYRTSRHPETTYNNDVWRWLEGVGVLEGIQQAGFNIIRSRERGKTTYAVLPGATILPVK